jgi:hypothetical protein
MCLKSSSQMDVWVDGHTLVYDIGHTQALKNPTLVLPATHII